MDDRTKKKPKVAPRLGKIILDAIGVGRKKNRKRVFREDFHGYSYGQSGTGKGAFGKNPMKDYPAPTNHFGIPITK